MPPTQAILRWPRKRSPLRHLQNEALSPPGRRQEGEKAEASGRLGEAVIPAGSLQMCPEAWLPLLRPLGWETLQQLCSGGWPSILCFL